MRYIEGMTYVSIHVPARGTTGGSGVLPFLRSGFNPRSREGNDPSPPMRLPTPASFNPRSREGNDASCCTKTPDVTCFNPRSREGNDMFSLGNSGGEGVSIHVPARGTTGKAADWGEGWKFQSTFPRGERLWLPRLHQLRQTVSIHVPARGTTGNRKWSRQ